MFWRFGFSSTSSLDTLLDRPNVSLEEILDEDELLQECKTQNSKLINYLQQPRVLKRLFEHVVGTAEVGGPGGREWEEKVRFKYPYIASEVLSSDIWSIVDTALSNSDDLLVPFWDSILSKGATSNPPTITQHQHPLFSESQKSQTTFDGPKLNASHLPTVPGEEASNAENSNVGVLGLEVKSNDDGTTLTTARDNGPGKSVLAGYWAKVNGVFLDKKPREMIAFIKELPQIVELFVAHMETPAVVDLLYRIIQCEEAVQNVGIIDWLSSEDLMPRLIDLLSPSHSTDLHNTVSELLKAIIALSAPSPASLTQGTGAEAFGFGGTDAMGGQANGQVGGVNNRLVRELASETIVRKMVGFMLDASLPSRLSRQLSEAAEEQRNEEGFTFSAKKKRDKPSVTAAESQTLSSLSEVPLDPLDKSGNSSDSALDDDDLDFDAGSSRKPLNPRDTPASGVSAYGGIGRSPGVLDHHRDSTATIRPSTNSLTPPVRAPEINVTAESCTSTLVTCIGILIELIRKNNSDYFEQHLFHTLRTHLLQRQQEIAERKASRTVNASEEKDEEAQQSKGVDGEEDEDDEMEGMEEAMAELSDKLGIVHLGPMLRVLCERLGDFQSLISRPRVDSTETVSSLGKTAALTFERYRITELYAELLHCSNMALLNRTPGEGPQYSEEGVLQGGIEGLQILARTLQGTDAASESGQDHTTTEKPAAEKAESTTTKTEGEEETQPSTKTGRHTRQSSVVGGGVGSEDTDDEALLSEVSLNDATTDTDKAASTEGTSPTDDAQSKDEGSSAQKGGEEEKADGQDDEEIRSVLSHLSLADLTAPSPSPSKPPSPIDDMRDYVIGDLLKKKFLECDVIPTILSLFFEFPWNNFLHNVVYDILQQFFNGRMDVGLNRKLTLAVFEQAKLTEKIVEGEKRNQESLKSPRKIRLGYMGHMHLIAEETVKLLERYPQEIAHYIEPYISPEWTNFVEHPLKENREKEAAPLAGGRPQMLHSLSFPQHGVGVADGDLGASGGQSVGSDAFANYLSSQMGTANASDDDDSDEDTNWLSQDIRQRNLHSGSGDAFDDAFEPDIESGSGIGRRGNSIDNDDDDDDWGPFADSSSSSSAVIGGPNSGSGSSAQAYLTPADWAADFQRETSANDDVQSFDGDDNSSTASESGNALGEEGVQVERARSDSGSSDTNGTPFVDLLDSASLRASDVVAAAHARRPSLEQLEGVPNTEAPTAAGEALDEKDPLGPGVAPDAQPNPVSGLIERTIDGQTVKVPLDEVALSNKIINILFDFTHFCL
ncbi:SAPS-domain-containing protein [Meira miltonrushii]|uniref:SAPS-domain-containing protein n=1 Tax=Meira miltonrushii TaxID=1280837 RepID=A0A316VA41_9BASI|nr:SAPS-domain-containing protein [Meira miltonrushii]PWN34366.1 SAPS-domain-containing protein [Meira miltonrushii]